MEVCRFILLISLLKCIAGSFVYIWYPDKALNKQFKDKHLDVSGSISSVKFAEMIEPYFKDHHVILFHAPHLLVGDVYEKTCESKWMYKWNCYQMITPYPIVYENVGDLRKAIQILSLTGKMAGLSRSHDLSKKNGDRNQITIYCEIGVLSEVFFDNTNVDEDDIFARMNSINAYKNNRFGCKVLIMMIPLLPTAKTNGGEGTYTGIRYRFKKDKNCGVLLIDTLLTICFRSLTVKNETGKKHQLSISKLRVKGVFQGLPANTKLNVTLWTQDNDTIEFKVQLGKMGALRYTELLPMTYKNVAYTADHKIRTVKDDRISYYCSRLMMKGEKEDHTLSWGFFSLEGRNVLGQPRFIAKKYIPVRPEVFCPQQKPRHCILGCLTCGTLWECVYGRSPIDVWSTVETGAAEDAEDGAYFAFDEPI